MTLSLYDYVGRTARANCVPLEAFGADYMLAIRARQSDLSFQDARIHVRWLAAAYANDAHPISRNICMILRGIVGVDDCNVGAATLARIRA